MNINSCSKFKTPGKQPGEQPVIIIGAGLSGLACAVTLIEHGYQVCLLESARHTGGRARSVKFKAQFSNQAVDNGQHIMLGAYHYTRSLFKSLGLKEADILQQQTLELKMFAPDKPCIHLKAPHLPAPSHLLMALLRTNGLSFLERIRAIKMALKLALSGYNLKQDMSVQDLLTQYQQSGKIISALWEPLCLATMNTPIKYASGQVFLNVLKDSFSRRRRDSDLLFFKFDLSRIFSTPAVQFINQYKSQVICRSKVTEVQISPSEQNTSIFNFCVNTSQGNYQSQHLVLATPPGITEKLLHSVTNRNTVQKQSFLMPKDASLVYSYEPICTIYLQYPAHIKLPQRMIGFFHSSGQWAIDRSLNQQPGLIAVVISGPGKHIGMPPEQLVETIHNELCLAIADLPTVIESKIITEKRATFSCRINIEQQRPANQTLIPGLYLAGDYTDTGYPSTLEGAIKSGISAARHLIQSNRL